MPLNKYQFDSLNIYAKALLMFNEGTFIDCIIDSGKCTNLYSLYDFFIAVVFEEDEAKIASIETVRDAMLKKYLSSIKLEELPF